jgi:hypothetical protein
MSLGLCERSRLIVIARKMQLRLQIMRDQSRHRRLLRRFSIVRYRNGSPSWYASVCSSSWKSRVANSTGLCSTRAGVRVDVPGWVPIDAGVHGVTNYGGGEEDLVAAEVLTGERSAEVGGGSGTGVDMLGGRELPTLPAPLKWTNSTVKLSYIKVELSSTALSHAHPLPLSNTTSRVMGTRCVPGTRMR